MGGDALHPLTQNRAATRYSPPCHDDATRGIRAGRVRCETSVAMHHANLRWINTQNLMGNLGERSFHALPVGLHADTNLKPAIRCEPCCRLLEAWRHWNTPGYEHLCSVCRLFGVGREANADKPAVRLALH